MNILLDWYGYIILVLIIWCVLGGCNIAYIDKYTDFDYGDLGIVKFASVILAPIGAIFTLSALISKFIGEKI